MRQSLKLNLTKSNTVGQITIGVKYGDFIKKIGGDNTLFPPYVVYISVASIKMSVYKSFDRL